MKAWRWAEEDTEEANRRITIADTEKWLYL
jgi:hypothetical protein